MQEGAGQVHANQYRQQWDCESLCHIADIIICYSCLELCTT